MTRLRHLARVVGHAAVCGFHDFGGTYTIWSWGFGLFLRMLTQVAFFASIGLLLGSRDQVEFLLVGNAVMAVAAGSLTATVATTWERGAGTLPLLVASPTSPLVVLMGRSQRHPERVPTFGPKRAPFWALALRVPTDERFHTLRFGQRRISPRTRSRGGRCGRGRPG